MAGFSIHLAIAKKYIEKNKIESELEFYEGIIAPDLSSNKDLSHYSDDIGTEDLILYLKGKVNMSKFLEEKDITTDYKKGFFLHLITDDLFYNNFFDIKYLKKVTYTEFASSLYKSYDYTNEYICNKYKIDLSILSNDFKKLINFKSCDIKCLDNILDLEELDKFIEDVSNIDLDTYEHEIKRGKL